MAAVHAGLGNRLQGKFWRSRPWLPSCRRWRPTASCAAEQITVVHQLY